MSDDVLLIGCGIAGAASPEEFGFKAYNLHRMVAAGLPVPPAFVLGTRFCRDFFRNGHKPPRGLPDLLAARLHDLERATGLGFGDARRPLLVSVRSGGAVSMPGMLDTVLDVGLCDATVPGLLRLTGNPRLVWDSYRRLVQSFAESVHGVDAAAFDAALARRLEESHVDSAADLDFMALRALTRDFLDLHASESGHAFPQQPLEQLQSAVIAVWRSWNGERAVHYRKAQGIPDESGTAVTVQRMVYGNAGGGSGAGVAFTRDPATGETALYLDFRFNAQGEDIVSGRHCADGDRIAAWMPSVYEEIGRVGRKLESEFRDMQELELTVQESRLFILQTRAGKRTPWAALRIAVDQVDEGLISSSEALARLASYDLDAIARPRIADQHAAPICHGVGAGGGVCTGAMALDPDRAVALARAGKPPILVRADTATADIAGIEAAAGVLTASGSRTSHAAVVARQLDKPCVVGCAALSIDLARRRCAVAGQWLDEDAEISIDGASGDVFVGRVAVELERPLDALAKVAAWRAGA